VIGAALVAVGQGGDASFESMVGDAINQPTFKLRLRVIFLTFTLLTALWTFLASLQLRSSGTEATFAALLILSSWEIAYHARWIAPDGLLMFWGACAVFLMLRALKAPRAKLWVRTAALAIGVCIGTKYHGGILLPFLLYVIYCRRNREVGHNEYTEAVLVAAAAFLLVTPGALVQPLQFIRDVRWEIIHYKITGHGAYDTASFLDHLSLIAQYLGLSAFSPYTLYSVMIAALSLIGACYFIRFERRAAMLIVLLPTLYVLYFATQKVMIVRNYLFLLPFMAILTARGATILLHVLRTSPLRAAATAVLLAGVIGNFLWLHRSAESIVRREAIDQRTDILSYVRANPQVTYALSPKVRSVLGDNTAADVANVRPDYSNATQLIYHSSEASYATEQVNVSRSSNRPGNYALVSGPADVNWDYYPTWKGHPRFLAIPVTLASTIGVAEQQ
jgi:hypothetical protein